VVSVPNSPAWAITWSEQGANGAPEPYFSLSLDGDTFTDPSGRVYWGNRGLNNNMWSNAGGKANTKDTVENVFVQTPTNIGTWKVTVIASELNQDTHVETAALDADYALVISGIKP